MQKPSPQTPLVAERFQEFYEKAGLPAGLLQTVHLENLSQLEALVGHSEVVHVAFTGSVAGGAAVQKSAMNSFKSIPSYSYMRSKKLGVCLELGGKDPAYVRPDANIEYSAAEIADGAVFNSGQSCCAIERVYVHETVYDTFLNWIVKELEAYTVGDPNGKNLEKYALTVRSKHHHRPSSQCSGRR